MNRIGPSFDDEIRAAGLAALPFSWGNDGDIQFGASMTQEQRAAVQAVYAAHDPNRESSRERDERTAKDRLLALAQLIKDGVAIQAEKDEALSKLIRRLVT